MFSKSSSPSQSPKSSSTTDLNNVIRLQKNNAEKQRRNRLNCYISELASLVPMISNSEKRLDKISILRLSAAHLRLYHSSLSQKNCKMKNLWRPDILKSENLSDLMEVINGFIMVTSHTGKILFVTQSVAKYLGHQDIDVIGHSLISFIHPNDQENVQKELKKLSTALEEDASHSNVRSTFYACIKEKSQPRIDFVNYQMMCFNCCLSDEGKSSKCKKLPVNSKEEKQLDPVISDGILLKVFVHPVKISPENELSYTKAFQEEYVTKHGTDGRILFADHRISTITGHLPHEVTGMLAYDYIFASDIPFAYFAQKLMFSSSSGAGMIVYRLKTRSNDIVYLKTIGHLQYIKSTNQISHFVCINKLLNSEEGEKELKKFTECYTPHLTSNSENECQITDSIASQILGSSYRYGKELDCSKQGSLPLNVKSDFSSSTPCKHHCPSTSNFESPTIEILDKLNKNAEYQNVVMDHTSDTFMCHSSVSDVSSPEALSSSNLSIILDEMYNMKNGSNDSVEIIEETACDDFNNTFSISDLETGAHMKIRNMNTYQSDTTEICKKRKRNADNFSDNTFCSDNIADTNSKQARCEVNVVTKLNYKNDYFHQSLHSGKSVDSRYIAQNDSEFYSDMYNICNNDNGNFCHLKFFSDKCAVNSDTLESNCFHSNSLHDTNYINVMESWNTQGNLGTHLISYQKKSLLNRHDETLLKNTNECFQVIPTNHGKKLQAG